MRLFFGLVAALAIVTGGPAMAGSNLPDMSQFTCSNWLDNTQLVLNGQPSIEHLQASQRATDLQSYMWGYFQARADQKFGKVVVGPTAEERFFKAAMKDCSEQPDAALLNVLRNVGDHLSKEGDSAS